MLSLIFICLMMGSMFQPRRWSVCWISFLSLQMHWWENVLDVCFLVCKQVFPVISHLLVSQGRWDITERNRPMKIPCSQSVEKLSEQSPTFHRNLASLSMKSFFNLEMANKTFFSNWPMPITFKFCWKYNNLRRGSQTYLGSLGSTKFNLLVFFSSWKCLELPLVARFLSVIKSKLITNVKALALARKVDFLFEFIIINITWFSYTVMLVSKDRKYQDNPLPLLWQLKSVK